MKLFIALIYPTWQGYQMLHCGNINVLDCRYFSVPSGVVLSNAYYRYHGMYFPQISKILNSRTHLTSKVLGKRMGYIGLNVYILRIKRVMVGEEVGRVGV